MKQEEYISNTRPIRRRIVFAWVLIGAFGISLIILAVNLARVTDRSDDIRESIDQLVHAQDELQSLAKSLRDHQSTEELMQAVDSASSGLLIAGHIDIKNDSAYDRLNFQIGEIRRSLAGGTIAGRGYGGGIKESPDIYYTILESRHLLGMKYSSLWGEFQKRENAESKLVPLSLAGISVMLVLLFFIYFRDQKRTRDQHRNLELFRRAIANYPFGIFIVKIVNRGGRKEFILAELNHAAEGMVGDKWTAVLGKDIVATAPIVVEEGIVAAIERVAGSGVPLALGERFFKGMLLQRGWYTVNVFPLYDDTVGASFESIDAKKKMELALRESEERWHLVVWASGDAIWDWNIQEDRMYYSEKWFTVSGYERQEVQNHLRNLSMFVHPDDLVRVEKILDGHLKKIVSSYSVEYRFKTKSGVYRWVRENARAVFNSSGMPVRIAGSISDIDAERNAVDELKREHILLRTVIDNLPDAIYAKDFRYRKTMSNLADVRNMNMDSEAQVLGKDDYAFFQKELADGFHADDMKVITEGRAVIDREEYLFDSNREKKWVRTTKLPLKDEKGKIVGLVGIGRDITIAKQAEMSLLESRRKLSEILEAFPIPTFVVDKTGVVTTWNRAMEELTGMTEKDIIGKESTDYTVPLYGVRSHVFIDWLMNARGQEQPDERYRVVRREGGSMTTEVIIPKLKGREVYLKCSASVLRDTEGNVTGGIESLIDISEMKRSESLLRATEQRFRLISDNVVDFISVVDLNYVCRYASGSFKLDGIDPDTFQGTNFLERVHPEDQNGLTALLRKVYDTFKYERMTFRFLDGRGTWRIKEATVNALPGNDGPELLIAMHDITERMEQDREKAVLQTELKKRNSALEKMIHEMQRMQGSLIQSEKLASIGQLVAGIAHEINNPLAYVTSNLNRFDEYFHDVVGVNGEWKQTFTLIEANDLISDKFKSVINHSRELEIDSLADDFAVLMKHTKEGAERIRKIVEQLRGFTHLSDGMIAEADLNGAIEDTLSIVWNEVKYKATVVKEYGEIPKLVCNVGEIKQVLVNLLVNASQSIKERGTITIKSELRDENICIDVIDTGSGMPKEITTKIFDPFFTTKPVGKGTGLGLWVSATIVQKHGGKILVDSEPGKGTKMTVVLPIEGRI